jgi:hypothetical protein
MVAKPTRGEIATARAAFELILLWCDHELKVETAEAYRLRAAEASRERANEALLMLGGSPSSNRFSQIKAISSKPFRESSEYEEWWRSDREYSVVVRPGHLEFVSCLSHQTMVYGFTTEFVACITGDAKFRAKPKTLKDWLDGFRRQLFEPDAHLYIWAQEQGPTS